MDFFWDFFFNQKGVKVNFYIKMDLYHMSLSCLCIILKEKRYPARSFIENWNISRQEILDLVLERGYTIVCYAVDESYNISNVEEIAKFGLKRSPLMSMYKRKKDRKK